MDIEKGFVLVVDDNENNRDMLSRWLQKQGYRYITAENGYQAINLLRSEPVDLMLLDIMMPDMNGFQVLEHLKENHELTPIPVIVVSAADDIESIVRCIELGAEDFLFKPFNRVLLKARIGASLEKKYLRDREKIYQKQIEEHNQHLETRVNRQVKEITAAQLATITAMAKLSESRDKETGKHLDRVREYCRVILEEYVSISNRKQEINHVYFDNIITASPLHDIGKVGIPDNILLKPGKLTAEEFNQMKNHTLIGAETLREVYYYYPENSFISTGIEIAECHHERWDGKGYPKGLSADDIPLSARIVALADVYDALTTRRCYKNAISHSQSIEIIAEERNTHFDPLITDCFLKSQTQIEEIQTKLQDVQ